MDKEDKKYAPKHAQNLQEIKEEPKLKTWVIVLLVILALILIAVGFLAYDAYNIKRVGYDLKDNVRNIASDIKNNEIDKAQDTVKTIKYDSNYLESKLNQPQWRIASKFPLVGQDISSAKNLATAANLACDNLLDKALTTFKEYPFSTIKQGEGFGVKPILAYVDLITENKDDIKKMGELLKPVHFKFIKGINSPIDKVNELLPMLDDYDDVLSLARYFLGDGDEDKLYVFVAQNTAEIRAGGGFPGSVGTINITDGVLTVGDFQSVVNVLPRFMPASCGVTAEENEMFGGWLGMHRDATFIPDFERAGEIWAIGYEEMNGKEVDGVVTALPQIIQKFLKILGPITLDDKYTLDGDNATKVIERDIYFDHFFRNNYTSQSNEITDAYFSQTAKLTMEKLVQEFSVTNLPKYADVISKSVEDRTFFMWMKDEDAQQLVRNLGASGALNFDENKPEAGVFLSCRDGDRLGIFAKLDTTMSKGKKNVDGSYTYDMKIVINNTMSDEVRNNARGYILGSYGGDMFTLIHLFAPMGGTVSDFKASNDMKFTISEYKGLQVGYANHFFVYRNEPITITYKLTTAPGVSEKPVISQTPTLQEYVDE